MSEELVIRYNEKTGCWEKHEPFATIDVMTEEEFNLIKAAVEHYQKRGHWIEVDDGVQIGDGKHLECSECGVWKKDRQKSNFCPNCGLKMDKE